VHPQKDNSIVGSLHVGLGFLIVSIGVSRVLDVASVHHRQDKMEGANGISGPWNFLASFLGISAGLFIIVFMGLLAVGMGILGCKLYQIWKF
jgi:hypothetical protein